MKRLILLLIFCLPAFGQFGNVRATTGAGAPTGACVSARVHYDTTGNVWYDCVDGAWVKRLNADTSGNYSIDTTLLGLDISTPANPAAGYTKFYAKSGKWCALSPAGVETCTGGEGGGSGDVTGPASAPEDGVPVFSDTTGKVLRATTCTINGGQIACPGGFTTGSTSSAGAVELFEPSEEGTDSVNLTVGAVNAAYTLVFPAGQPDGQMLQFGPPLDGISQGTWVARRARSIGVTVDGAGTAVSTGLKSCSTVWEAGTVTGWTIKTKPGATGSAVVDVWAAQPAGYAAMSASNSIAGANKPTLTGAAYASLSGLSWVLSAGDEVCFNVDSASTATWLSVVLKVE